MRKYSHMFLTTVKIICICIFILFYEDDIKEYSLYAIQKVHLLGSRFMY